MTLQKGIYDWALDTYRFACEKWGEENVIGFDAVSYTHLRRIILPDGVKRIEEMAFSYCINLEEVNIPSSLQYLEIGRAHV